MKVPKYNFTKAASSEGLGLADSTQAAKWDVMSQLLSIFFDWSSRDERFDGWPMMQSVWPTLAVCCVYIFLAKVAGPLLMGDRDAIDVTIPIRVYNMIQTIMHFAIARSWLVIYWKTDYNWLCPGSIMPTEPGSDSYHFLVVSYWCYLVRFLTMFDSFFLVARKRFKQVDFGHVLLHSLCPIYFWINMRFATHDVGDLFIAFATWFMTYLYRLVDTMGPEFKKHLYWKQHLTTLQTTSMTVVFTRKLLQILGLRHLGCNMGWQQHAFSGYFNAMLLALHLRIYVVLNIVKQE